VNTFIIGLELESLKSFVEHVTGSAHTELQTIDSRADDGVFETIEDLEFAENPPFAWMQYVSRAVYYELASLVEYHLHLLASAPWAASQRKNSNGPAQAEGATMDELLRGISEIKTEVSDLGFGKVCELILAHYGTRISDVDGWAEVKEIRNVVNDLKHRGGYRHIKTIDCVREGFPQCRQIDPQQASDAIDSVGRFFRALNGRIAARG
jgi:hypothetical protein